MAKQPTSRNVEQITHDDAKRKNIPTAEYQSVMQKDERSPMRVADGDRHCYPNLAQMLQEMEKAN